MPEQLNFFGAILNFNSLAAVIFIGLAVAISFGGRVLVYALMPKMNAEKAVDRDANIAKMKKAKYPPNTRKNRWVGFIVYATFTLVAAPYVFVFAEQPWWMYCLEVFVILMVYDFLYYLVHRFLFHGNGPLVRVHGVHHQARDPSSIDAYYLHALETFLGIFLYVLVTCSAALLGHPVDAISAGIAAALFVNINLINHCCQFSTKDSGIHRLVNFYAYKHSLHHLNMQKGNYATITLLYDWMFGTLEK